ncbi:GTP-binding protein [Nonomuraea aurantiaca]|uniref:GTP-binding protein n=1 Tax=Nonomuraea aurantiaca TaxID=2878562 RepID=UPI001CD93EC6|nr:GTP-binding protein [Nonomuraea aurantiaca]MCA2222077.1 GTP-binding protein [Nonomuraea aurantiaca]
MHILNIGILAHVDAGKTSLTERLLFRTGAIDRLGRVDDGSTQTDSGAIERRRGITIRTAVASFTVGDLRVNLIDTPGHADFVAEVERALGVLDGAVLVLSAVEGVQPHSRLLMKTLRRLRVPTLIFVNKIDRAGARERELLDDIRRWLSPYTVALNTVEEIGGPDARTRRIVGPDEADRSGDSVRGGQVAEMLAEHDDGILESLVEGRAPSGPQVWAAMARQCADGVLHPVLFGSAMTGRGVGDLLDGFRLLPATAASGTHASGGTLGATVFAIERGAAGEKVAYLRMRSGVLRARQRVPFHRLRRDGTVEEYGGRPTAVRVAGSAESQAVAGDIAKVWGVPEIRVGDHLGTPPDSRLDTPPGDQLSIPPASQPGTPPGSRLSAPPGGHPGTPPKGAPKSGHFPAPSLETVVRPRIPGQEGRLHAALAALAEQDPLIGTRALPGGRTSVLLYGEVQKEVIAETLAAEFGVEAVFEPTRPVYLERPARRAEIVEEIARHGRDDFVATVGLRVEPAAIGSGVGYRLGVDLGSLPLAFHRAIEDTVRDKLSEGPHGWPVTDCLVTLTRTGYASPITTAADFRGRTTNVLRRALRQAGTRVYEPCNRFELEVPPESLSAATVRLAALGGVVADAVRREAVWLVSGDIPAVAVREFELALPGLSHGEGVWWSQPFGDRPARR